MQPIVEIIVRNWEAKIAILALISLALVPIYISVRRSWLPYRNSKEGRDNLKKTNQLFGWGAIFIFVMIFTWLSLPAGA